MGKPEPEQPCKIERVPEIFTDEFVPREETLALYRQHLMELGRKRMTAHVNVIAAVNPQMRDDARDVFSQITRQQALLKANFDRWLEANPPEAEPESGGDRSVVADLEPEAPSAVLGENGKMQKKPAGPSVGHAVDMPQ
jgi:hypothetical protein